jgi:hypothetical protein
MIMKIPATTDLISDFWTTAELAAREALSSHHWDNDEEFITNLFIGELRRIVYEASNSGRVRAAFLQDLTKAFSDELGGSLEQIAEDITATIVQHPRQVETKTGGDIGLVIVRPIVRRTLDRSRFVIDDNYQRGLLCQAKVNRRAGRRKRSAYGSLTKNQKKILPSHMRYLALLLYRYADHDRRYLDPFFWQPCDTMSSIDQVLECLKSGSFPEPLESRQVIDLLGNNRIGTDDKKIIAEYIAPEVRPALIIRIGWPKRPPQEVLSQQRVQQEMKVVLVRQS